MVLMGLTEGWQASRAGRHVSDGRGAAMPGMSRRPIVCPVYVTS